MIENSPRPRSVRPTLNEVAPDWPALLPANSPARTTPNSDSNAAPIASHTAPPKLKGSTVRPKLKKKIAPKKSRNGTTNLSIRPLCSVSPRTKPNSNAPMASATWMVSPSPANRNRQAKTTMTKTSFDEMRNNRLSSGVAHRPRIIKPTMNISASPADDKTPVSELAPLKTIPESSDRYTAKKTSSYIVMPSM